MYEAKPHNPQPENTNDLVKWRLRMGYSAQDAANELGCRLGEYRRWEAATAVPRYIRLACAALALGITAEGKE